MKFLVNVAMWALLSAAYYLIAGTFRWVFLRAHLFELSVGYGPVLASRFVGQTLVKVKALPLGFGLSFKPSEDPNDNQSPEPPPGRRSLASQTFWQGLGLHFADMLTMALLAIGLVGGSETTRIVGEFWPVFFDGLLDPFRGGIPAIGRGLHFMADAGPLSFAGTVAAALTAWNLGHLVTPLGPFSRLFVEDPNDSPVFRKLFAIYVIVLGVSILSYFISLAGFVLRWLFT